MRILVKSRDSLVDLASERGRVAIVSISDDPDDFPDIPCDCLCILRQHFHDVEVAFSVFQDAPIAAFTEAQATEVAGFVSSLPSEVETLVFQCEAGISRSAAMAAAVARHLGQDDMPFFRNHVPNRRVYRMTLEALRGWKP